MLLLFYLFQDQEDQEDQITKSRYKFLIFIINLWYNLKRYQLIPKEGIFTYE